MKRPMHVIFDVLDNGWHRAICQRPSFYIAAPTIYEVCAQIASEVEFDEARRESKTPLLRVVK